MPNTAAAQDARGPRAADRREKRLADLRRQNPHLHESEVLRLDATGHMPGLQGRRWSGGEGWYE